MIGEVSQEERRTRRLGLGVEIASGVGLAAGGAAIGAAQPAVGWWAVALGLAALGACLLLMRARA